MADSLANKTLPRRWLVTERSIFDRQELTWIKRELGSLKGRASKAALVEWASVAIPLNAGLRVSELGALKCGDLYLTDSCPFLYVRNGKGGKGRTVKLSTDFSEELKFYLERKKELGLDGSPESPVITSRKTGQHLSDRALQHSFKRVVTRSGVRKRNNHHMARHTYATYLLVASNLNLIFVRDQLGHCSIEITQIYLHVIPGEDQKALIRLYR